MFKIIFHLLVRIGTSLFVTWSAGYQFERQVQYGLLWNDIVENETHLTTFNVIYDNKYIIS